MQSDPRLRYSRHLALAGFDESTQKKLTSGSVLLIGAGGLGCPVATYLAASGVGSLVISDFDLVDESNLHRQVLFTEADIGRSKVEAAAEHLAALNASTCVDPVDRRLQGDELIAAARRADLVIDCSDNFGTRFDVNHACVTAKSPLISGAAIRMEGQVAVFGRREQDGPCYQCLYPEAGTELEDCQGQGILGPVAGVIGTMVSVEALKILADIDGAGMARLHRYDAVSGEWKSARIARDPDCPACSRATE